MKKIFIMLSLVLGFFFLQACSDNDTNESNIEQDGTNDGDKDEKLSEWNDYADTSTDFLISKYWRNSAGYFVKNHIGDNYAGYWPQAHAMDVVIDGFIRNKELYELTDDSKYYAKYSEYSNLFDRWYNGIYAGNGNRYVNHYFDDMEWIALTMIRLYEATGNQKYLTTAKELWDAIKTAWSEDLGGGLFWRGYDNHAEKTSKNACSNGPGCLVALRLYANDVDKNENLDWAKRIFAWEKENLVGSDGRVYDNKDLSGKVTEWIFTYNQGTYLGSAHELYKITGERSYLNDATMAASYTIDFMTDGNGILKKEGSSNGDDAGLFRAVFIRYFVKLVLEEDLNPSLQSKYNYFLTNNSKTLWNTATENTYYWGRDWTVGGVPGNNILPDYDMQCQTSGCTLIEARALYENELSKKKG